MVQTGESQSILAENWRPTQTPPALASGAIHLWATVLDDQFQQPGAATNAAHHMSASQPDLSAHRALLSADEIRRADRIRRPLQHQRFVVGRALLRRLLGRYLNTAAESLAFSYNGMGKPHLPQATEAGLSFNLAHSGALVVYAVAQDAAVGVDVEAIRSERKLDGIARRFFTASEWQALANLEGDDQVHAFYRIWTQKEAYVKAHGDGLLAQIDQFDVAVAPDVQLGLQHHRLDQAEVGRWQFLAPRGLHGYAATLATDGPCHKIDYLRCT